MNREWAKSLSRAIRLNNPASVYELVRAGGDLQAMDDRGFTPLQVAASWDNVEAARLLLDKGADIEARASLGQTPLHRAAIHAGVEVVRLLCERGANVNARDKHGLTPMEYAANYGRVSIMQILMAAGADLSVNGLNALRHGVSMGHADAVNLLVSWGVGCELTQDERARLMMQAARRGHIDVVRILLKSGFPSTGEVVACAERYGRDDIAVLLRSNARG